MHSHSVDYHENKVYYKAKASYELFIAMPKQNHIIDSGLASLYLLKTYYKLLILCIVMKCQ